MSRAVAGVGALWLHGHMRYLPALLTVSALACTTKDPSSDDDIADDSSGSESTDESAGDCPPFPDLPVGDTTTEDTDTTDTETDTTESTDTGELADWYVMTGAAIPVGRLASPGADEFALPGNMFSGSVHRFAYLLTPNNYAFTVNQHRRIFHHLHTDNLYFTGLDCDGTALDHFGRRITDDQPITSMLVCVSDADIDGSVEAFYFPYGFREERKAWLDLNWPGASGFLYDRLTPSLGKQWYEMPIDQEWPSWQVANSVLHVYDNTCEQLPEPMVMCAVEFYVSEYVAGIQDGPFHLEQMP